MSDDRVEKVAEWLYQFETNRFDWHDHPDIPKQSYRVAAKNLIALLDPAPTDQDEDRDFQRRMEKAHFLDAPPRKGAEGLVRVELTREEAEAFWNDLCFVDPDSKEDVAPECWSAWQKVRAGWGPKARAALADEGEQA